MAGFNISVDVAAPPARVWQVMSDVDRWHEWTPSITSVNRIGGAPLAVGGRAFIKQPKFPPALWTVTEIVPGSHFIWVSSNPGLKVTGIHRVEAIAGGSRATLGIEMDGLFSGLFWRLTGAISERYVTFESQGLKARSENPSYRVK
jgi:hypothetical protein